MELTWPQWREVALGLKKAVDQDCALLQVRDYVPLFLLSYTNPLIPYINPTS